MPADTILLRHPQARYILRSGVLLLLALLDLLLHLWDTLLILPHQQGENQGGRIDQAGDQRALVEEQIADALRLHGGTRLIGYKCQHIT